MTVYETGRTRTVEFEVQGNQEGHLKVFIDTPFAEYYEQSGGCDFIFEFIPGMFNFPYLRFQTQGSIGTVSWWCYAGFNFDSENSDNGFQAPPSYDESYEIRVANEFYGKVTIPGVKEVFEVVDLAADDYDTLDGTKFPSFGGTAQGDGLPAKKQTFYEVIPEGTEILLEANVGSASITNSFVTPSDIVLTYPVRVVPIIEASVDLGTVGDTNQIVGDWEVLFQGETLVANWGTITPDSQGSFIDWNNGKARAILSMSGSGYGVADADMYLAPPITYKCYFKALSFGSNYPGSIGLWLWDRAEWGGSSWIPTYKEVTANPTYFEQVSQEFRILTGGTNLSSNPSVDLEEWAGLRWNLDPSNLNGEDPNDWRVQIRGTQGVAFSIVQDESFTLDDGSSASGWSGGANTTYSNSGGAQRGVVSGGLGSLIWDAEKNLEGYRYLDIRIKSTDANKPFTLKLAHTDGEDKEYSGVTGAADTYSTIRIDLCLPDDLTDDDDSADDDAYTQGSRYPLESGASSVPTTSDNLWGFNQFDTLTIDGLEDGQTYDVDFVKLERNVFGQVDFLPAFEPWKNGFTSNQVKSHFWTNADGRFSDEALAFKQSSSYSWLAISGFESAVERRLGWTVDSSGAAYPTDGYHSSGLEALRLEGGGVRWVAASTFIPAYSLDAAEELTIYWQDLWDEVQVYPYAGDVWSSGAYGPETEVGAAKQLRGGLRGLVYGRTDLDAESGATVALKTHPGLDGAGTGSADSQGFYVTGSSWGSKGQHIAVCADVESPEFAVFNRFPQRMSFLVELPGGDCHAVSSIRTGLAYCVVTSPEEGVRLHRFSPLSGSSIDDFDVAPSATAAQVAISPNERLVVVFVDDGVYRTFSESHGEDWSEPELIHTGEEVAIAISSNNGIEFHIVWEEGEFKCYRSLDGGETFELAGTVVVADQSRPGLTLSPTSSAVLVCTLGNVRRFLSTDSGETWEEVV